MLASFIKNPHKGQDGCSLMLMSCQDFLFIFDWKLDGPNIFFLIVKVFNDFCSWERVLSLGDLWDQFLQSFTGILIKLHKEKFSKLSICAENILKLSIDKIYLELEIIWKHWQNKRISKSQPRFEKRMHFDIKIFHLINTNVVAEGSGYWLMFGNTVVTSFPVHI